MKSQDILYSKGKNHECMTPVHAVKPILHYIPKKAIVWCPFDKEDSEFVKQIREINEVVFSHIDSGDDFYNFEPDKWDVMVSNPPFTNKRRIFERALKFGKPFALLMSLTWLNDKYSKKVFMDAEKQMQLMMFDNRIHFKDKNGKTQTKTTFSSAYYCSDFLPESIILKKL